MKKLIIISILVFAISAINAQDLNTRVPVLGEQAPSVTVSTTNGKINFPSDFGKSWKILFSHPQDFTPVCSSELLELAHMQKNFEKLNTKFLILSTDALYSHNDWKKALEEINFKNRGITKINFPIAADDDYMVSRKYGMIHASSSSSKTVRAVFIIDPDNVIQTIMWYPMSVGRNLDEIERTLVALQTVAKKEISTPANWQVGNDVFTLAKPTAEELSDPSNGIKELTWFMVYRKLQ